MKKRLTKQQRIERGVMIVSFVVIVLILAWVALTCGCDIMDQDVTIYPPDNQMYEQDK